MIETVLEMFSSDKPPFWFDWLPLAEWWYNTTSNSSTKLNPYEVVYGVARTKLQAYVPRLTSNQAKDDVLRTMEHI